MKNSFVMYTDYQEQLELLTMEQRGYLLTAIMAYVSGDQMPEMDGITRMAFSFIRAGIDRDAEKYQKTVEARQEAGKLGGRPKANGFSEKQTKAKKANGFSEKQTKAKKPDNDNENDSVSENDTENIKTRGRFTPPTIQELDAYITEHGYHVDAEKFLDYYNSNGWMVGKNHMKDWKAAVRNWSRNQRQGTTANGTQGMTVKTTKFSNFPERKYDYDDLEGQLLAAQGGMANGS